MKSIFIWLPILIACSCNFQQKPSARGHADALNDTLAYEELLTAFDARYAEIEMAYEQAGPERQEELELAYEELELEQVEAQKEFIKAYPNSGYCLPILWEIDWSFHSAAEFRSYLDLIDSSRQHSDDYKRLASVVNQMQKVEVGRLAPDFEMEDTEGNLVMLSDAYRDTKYLLLDFWASTCGPCRKENLIIRSAYDQYHSYGFDVMGVSTDVRKEPWLEAIEKDGLIWTNLCSLQKWNENEIVKTYVLRQVSQNFLLDSSGKIIATNLRGEDLLKTLGELLN